MKQIILIGVLTGLLTATIPIRAQVALRDSDARKGSRLELGRTTPARKTNAAALPAQRFSINPNQTLSGLDRSMALHKNSTINEHYKTLLVARSVSKPTVRTASADNNSPAVTADLRPVTNQEGKGENRMYTNEKIWVSNVFPNPADDVAEIDYQFSGPAAEAKLVLLNVLGAPVAEYELERNDRKLRIVTRDFATGYYLYQLSVDGKKVATKRLLVRHQ
ncbi:T9SS type A sorting domain-containing protein [Spirosoma soli]|uniref:T9SS type A sorting domain-containing protein n=1 Tax=Spirosoma soli TaxID=1770529 RepID=A0ABW5M9F9_9BACT